MDKIKSSLELAMEKTRNIKGEKREAQEIEKDKYIKAARSMAQSFLEGKLEKEKISESLKKHPKQYHSDSIKAFVSAAANGIDLDNTPRVLEIIELLQNDEKTQEYCAKAREVYDKYRAELEKEVDILRKNAEQFMRRKLEKEGIKGSALAGFNLQKHEQWEEINRHLNEKYRQELQYFLQAL